MRLTKHQQNIIRKIASGEIQDLYTYLISCNLDSYAQYNRAELEQSFMNDTIPKEYYYPQNLSPKFSTIEIPKEFEAKVNKGLINPDRYNKFSLKLNSNYGIKHLTWNGVDYELNFYNGVHIANSFNDIVSFLSLWQYLKSEMLILDLPADLTAKTLGLFYEKRTEPRFVQPENLEDCISKINFSDCSYDDSNYFNGIDYQFSFEHCTICKEYLGRKIYPTPELNTFIQRNFKTIEEKTQKSTLLAAWLAIFVAILLSIISNFQKHDSEYLLEIATEINNLQTQLSDSDEQLNNYNKELLIRLEEIKLQLEILDKSFDYSSISEQIDCILEELKRKPSMDDTSMQ